jgi:hypothetical protein
MTPLQIKPSDDCRWHLVAVGEVMLRLDPAKHESRRHAPPKPGKAAANTTSRAGWPAASGCERVTQAHRRGAQALERLDAGDWPPASVVGDAFGTWKAARGRPDRHMSPDGRSHAATITCSTSAAGHRGPISRI